ncbi:MAG: cation diffusion facilitator family transporter [Rhodospirillaceae bacterium]|nr:cation diffusion facilitator family transporter [Rhodospirillaceae bacterium]
MTETTSNRSPAALMRLATRAAVACAVLLIAVKTWAYLHTGSVALLSSLADSALDLLASGLNLIAVRFALTPADDLHRFGHGKAEPLSGLGQAAFVAGSAVLIIVQAISRLHDTAPVTDAGLGIGVTLLSIAVTLGLVTLQRYVIARTSSMAVSADSLHYTGDLLLNASVIAALALASMPGLAWADPVFGIAISVFILVNAVRIAIRSVDALMDKELPTEERERIIAIALQHPKAKRVHELRTRSSGMQKHIQMHIVLDPTLTLLEAHRICDDVEKAIEGEFPGVDIIIHEDPDGIPEYHPRVGL